MSTEIKQEGLEGLKEFVAEHWKSILAITVGVTVVSAGLYSLTKSSTPTTSGAAGAAGEAAGKRAKKSGKKRQSQAKKAAAGMEKTNSAQEAVSDLSKSQESIEGEQGGKQVETKAPSPTELAMQAKQEGNQLFSQKKYEEAIAKYTTAIDLAPTAVFFCNRAACYANLQKYEQVISDCTEAIKLDSKYIKAFHRRALSYEALGQVREALNEYTAVCALEGFKNKNSMAAPDRLLQALAAERTKEIMTTKVHVVPSETFVSAYMDSFRSKPSDATIVLALKSEDLESDNLLKQAYQAAEARKWQESFDLCDKAIASDSFAADFIKAKALNFRGTLYFLMGRVDDAVADLENSLTLDQDSVNTLIKRATLYMERGDLERTLEQLEKAEFVNPSNPDLYYHRGQVRFLTGDFQGAVDDYQKSIASEKSDESSVYVHIQMGVALYKLGDISGAEKKFREAKKSFPESAEVWNYHGEILMDKQSFNEAERSFDKSIEMDPSSPLPYINKAILQLQWKQDSNQAEELCRTAIQIDPLCDIGYTQLAQLLCLQNKLEEAIVIYDEAIKIARTEAEIMNVISSQEAAKAQLFVVNEFPSVMESLQRHGGVE